MRPTNAYAIGVLAVIDQLVVDLPWEDGQDMLQQIALALQDRIEEREGAQLELENGLGT